jgi:hypothetical protein
MLEQELGSSRENAQPWNHLKMSHVGWRNAVSQFESR